MLGRARWYRYGLLQCPISLISSMRWAQADTGITSCQI